jgi:hypothetical protein
LKPFQWRGEGWVRFNEAVMAALMELETGVGVLQRRLRQQCASGDVRSIRCQGIFEEGEVFQVIEDPTLINPREWTQDNLDFTADDPEDESKPISTVIAVSEADLWHWIAGIEETEGGPVVRSSGTVAKPKGGKVPRIKDRLAGMFPEGVPDPAHCVRKELQGRLLKADPTLAPLDLKTLKAAIDEYNAGKR